jgi:hypothetical protein
MTHFQKLLAAPSFQCRAIQRQQGFECRIDRVAHRLNGGCRIAMRAANRLQNNLVHQPQTPQIVRGQPQRFRRQRRLRGISPEDRRAAFRRNHGVNRVLQHQHPIAGGKGDRPARSTLADNGGDEWNGGFKTSFDRSGDRFRLAPRLGVDSRERTRCVDERQDRQTEAARQLDQAAGLAVAFGPRHSEIVGDSAVGVRAFLGPKNHDGAPTKPAKPTQHRRVVGERAIAGQWREPGDQPGDMVGRLGPVGMPRDLGFLPRRQFGVCRPQLAVGDGSQTSDLFCDIKTVRLRHSPEFLDLALQFGDWLFEVEEVAHGRGRLAWFQPGGSPPGIGSRTARPGGKEMMDLNHDATRSIAIHRLSEPMSGPEPCVAILLSTFDGERYLGEQLRSYGAQSHTNWLLYWRDDGSSDSTLTLMDAFAEGPASGQCIRIGESGRLGATGSFLVLLRQALRGPASFFAFSDQDDVWLPDKLAHGVAALARSPSNRPALYFCARALVDASLRPIGRAPAPCPPPAFPAALAQNVIPGCCMILNRAAAELIDAAVVPDVTWHDWWSYLVVSAGDGLVLSGGASPDILYRQHGDNLVGETSGFWFRSARAVRRGRTPFMSLLRRHVDALRARPGLMPERTRALLTVIDGACQGSMFARLRALRIPGFVRQTWLETQLFRLWFLLG